MYTYIHLYKMSKYEFYILEGGIEGVDPTTKLLQQVSFNSLETQSVLKKTQQETKTHTQKSKIKKQIKNQSLSPGFSIFLVKKENLKMLSQCTKLF